MAVAQKGDADGSGGTSTGGSGDDIVEGGLGKDILFGDLGDNFLFGFEGSDQLFGQEGNDMLLGGAGNELHMGGEGADVLFFEVGGGKDTVLDFELGLDIIAFKGSYGINEADVRVKLQKSGDIQIAYGGDAMLLEGEFNAGVVGQLEFVTYPDL
jgi:Ca2+-binding RTX toxin-like protein